MRRDINRRAFIEGLGASAMGMFVPSTALLAATQAPTAPVAVATCSAYGSEIVATLARMFDQLGGLQKLVRGKTVAIKINVTGGTSQRYRGMAQGQTYWVHPDVVSATVHLLGMAGARRIRLLESPTGSQVHSLEEFLQQSGLAALGFHQRCVAC